MPDDFIQKIIQDSYGYMWVGTQNGLVKYDGYEMEVFQIPVIDESRLDKAHTAVISVLEEAENGDIWIGTIHGELARFDRKNNRLVPFSWKPLQKNSSESEPDNENPKLTSAFADSVMRTGQVQTLLPDSDGNIWLGMGNKSGFFKVEPDASTFHQKAGEIKDVTWFTHENDRIEYRGRVFHLFEGSGGVLWALGDYGLFRFHEESMGGKVYQPVPDTAFNYVNYLIEGADWVKDSTIFTGSFDGGLQIFDIQTETFSSYTYGDSLIENSLMKKPVHNCLEVYFHQKNTNKLWVSALFLDLQPQKFWKFLTFDLRTKMFEPVEVRLASNKPNLMDWNWINSICQDRSGNLWVGGSGGLYKMAIQNSSFSLKRHNPAIKNGLSSDNVSVIFSDEKENVFFSTEKGIDRFDPESGIYTNYRYPYRIHNAKNESTALTNHNYVWDMAFGKDGYVWLAADHGLEKFNPSDGSFIQIDGLHDKVDALEKCDAVATDKKGNLWISFSGRLTYWEPETGVIKHYRYPGYQERRSFSEVITSIVVDDFNTVWLGSEGNTFYSFNPDEIPETEMATDDLFEKYEITGGKPKFVDSQGNLWARTYASGVVRINTKTKEVEQFTTEDGLAHNKTYGILEDNKGCIWIGTFHGLSCFDPQTETFQNYFQSDGLPINSITGKNPYKSKNGELFFSSFKGVLSFHPDEIIQSPITPQVVFTSFKVFGEELEVGGDSPLSQHISLTEEVQLEHWQNDLSIKFSALHFNSPEKNHYKVFLEKNDRDWRELGTERTAIYTNISPGEYVFRVKASNNDGVWNEEGISLRINIAPPWWATWSAYTSYFLIFATVLVLIYRFQIKRRLQVADMNRLKELNDFKARFYTNITHEFRTPLTVILGLTDNLVHSSASNLLDASNMIRRNARALLNLVNQLLALSKIEAGSMALQFQQGDVVAFVKYTVEPFQALTEKKKISISVDSEVKKLVMDYDPEKLNQVISNLLSNAVKFTQKGGVTVRVAKEEAWGNEYFLLSVKDSGIGITEDKLQHIFDLFYQADDATTREHEGSGVGLALAKDLIRLMGGEISVESVPNEGTEFSILLPITNEAKMMSPKEQYSTSNWTVTDVLAEVDEIEEAEVGEPEERNVALVVEDNPDLRAYLKTCLGDTYQVRLATNGVEGVEKALHFIPDVIVCDIMMPKLDGLALCKRLKQDEKTSHIPIVFLTAKATVGDRINGLNLGADAYLTKPFHKEELLVTVSRCVAIRRQLRTRYAQLGPFPSTDDLPTKVTDNFLIKLNKVIDGNLENPDFDITFLTEEMAMSRTQLHRKITSITGKNTSGYIRFHRLEKARKMLETTDLTLAEISFKVGFNEPSYFSRAYLKEYNIQPSEVRKQSKSGR
ncbi:ATP-binding protein [Flammeovirgaceae bacterium SG7u.111]|nr:ATP-binding protein [Flammeovirgaceae bacterium SG7u.132]WPO34415.1 ATP-binding protein [Flammeovirgaceae bacterium SG7u.111]